ncbi:MAG: signal peptidase I [Pseudohongiellaceae bacterium]|jgi:signal peptidase I
MDIDFPLVLVILTFGTGFIYLLDIIFWKAKRDAANKSMPDSSDELAVKEPWVIETSRSFFPVLAIVLILRSFLVEPFQIPSGSMLPTLEVGDFILVNKFSYGLRLPVLGTKILSIDDPESGDVMVFKYPKDGKTNYIKRVIGTPGDIIKYKDKTLFINGAEVPEHHIATLPSLKLFEEKLGAATHQLYENRHSLNTEAEGEWLVPENSYFMMGDNRDNSNDSRFWGFVPDHLVVGKAFAIWMQWKSFTSLPSFSRVGGIE